MHLREGRREGGMEERGREVAEFMLRTDTVLVPFRGVNTQNWKCIFNYCYLESEMLDAMRGGEDAEKIRPRSLRGF